VLLGLERLRWWHCICGGPTREWLCTCVWDWFLYVSLSAYGLAKKLIHHLNTSEAMPQKGRNQLHRKWGSGNYDRERWKGKNYIRQSFKRCLMFKKCKGTCRTELRQSLCRKTIRLHWTGDSCSKFAMLLWNFMVMAEVNSKLSDVVPSVEISQSETLFYLSSRTGRLREKIHKQDDMKCSL